MACIWTFDKTGKAKSLGYGPLDVQKTAFRELVLKTKDGNDEIVAAQLWTSRGMEKRKKWLTAEQLKANSNAMEGEDRRVAEEKAATDKAEREKANKAAKDITAAETAGREQEKKQAAQRAEREKLDHPEKKK